MTRRRDGHEAGPRKLEGRPDAAVVSSPAPGVPQLDVHRILSLQCSAGNAAVASLLREVSAVPDFGPAQGPVRKPTMIDDPGPQPAGMDHAEKAFFAELRSMTRARTSVCFSKYQQAAMEIKKEHEDKQSGPGFLEQLIDLAVGALAPGFVGFVLDPLREELKSIASLAIERAVDDADRQVKTYLKAERLVAKHLADEDRAGQAWKVLKGAYQSNVRPDQPVGTMLDDFVQEFSVYLDEISDKLAGKSGADQLAAYTAFDPKKATKDYYKRQIEDLLMWHQSLARVAEREKGDEFYKDKDYTEILGDRLVMLESRGVKELAIVTKTPRKVVRPSPSRPGDWGPGNESLPTAMFVAWVPKDMRSTAKELGEGQEIGLRVVAGEDAFDAKRHKIIVVDVKAPSEGVQYAEIMVRGRPRLAQVTVESGEHPIFGGWVEPRDAHYARAKGERQHSGISRITDSEMIRVGATPVPVGSLPPPPISGPEPDG